MLLQNGSHLGLCQLMERFTHGTRKLKHGKQDLIFGAIF
jgi:hypothetical protein